MLASQLKPYLLPLQSEWDSNCGPWAHARHLWWQTDYRGFWILEIQDHEGDMVWRKPFSSSGFSACRVNWDTASHPCLPQTESWEVRACPWARPLPRQEPGQALGMKRPRAETCLSPADAALSKPPKPSTPTILLASFNFLFSSLAKLSVCSSL